MPNGVDNSATYVAQKDFGRWRVIVYETDRGCVASFLDLDVDERKFPGGQFTGGCYYIATLLGEDGYGTSIRKMSALSLDFGVPAWTVKQPVLREIADWIEHIRDARNFSKSPSKRHTEKRKPIAGYCLSNTMCIEIYEIEYGIDEWVHWGYGDGKVNRSKLKHKDGRPCFNAGGNTIFLDMCSRTDLPPKSKNIKAPKRKVIATHYSGIDIHELEWGEVVWSKKGGKTIRTNLLKDKNGDEYFLDGKKKIFLSECERAWRF